MTASQIATILVTLGGILLASLAADTVGRRTKLPRVTLLIVLGLGMGPVGLDIVPERSLDGFPLIADLALVMVAFLLGGELTPRFLREHGRVVLIASLVVVGMTAIVVSAGLLLGGWSLPVALMLGAIATSTDPAAISDVVHEADARGPFSKTLLGIVAVDDAWGIAVVSFALAVVLGMQSPEAARVAMLEGGLDLVGAIGVGCAVGLPIALLSGRVRAGEPTLAEALGGVMLCGGISMMLDVSFLLAAMTMGVVVANLARHHTRSFRAIEGIEWPFMVFFFVLSGASLGLERIAETLLLATLYVLLRVAGRFVGGVFGARLASRPAFSRGLGVALLPQAGIAIGMALVVSERLPEQGEVILSATVLATVFFEITGPILTRRELARIGEVDDGRGARSPS